MKTMPLAQYEAAYDAAQGICTSCGALAPRRMHDVVQADGSVQAEYVHADPVHASCEQSAAPCAACGAVAVVGLRHARSTQALDVIA